MVPRKAKLKWAAREGGFSASAINLPLQKGGGRPESKTAVHIDTHQKGLDCSVKRRKTLGYGASLPLGMDPDVGPHVSLSVEFIF